MYWYKIQTGHAPHQKSYLSIARSKMQACPSLFILLILVCTLLQKDFQTLRHHFPTVMSERCSHQWARMLLSVRHNLNSQCHQKYGRGQQVQTRALCHTSISPVLAVWWTVNSSSSSSPTSSSPSSSLPKSLSPAMPASPAIPTPLACPSLLKMAGSFQYLEAHWTDDPDKWTDAAWTQQS